MHCGVALKWSVSALIDHPTLSLPSMSTCIRPLWVNRSSDAAFLRGPLQVPETVTASSSFFSRSYSLSSPMIRQSRMSLICWKNSGDLIVWMKSENLIMPSPSVALAFL